MIPEDHRTQYVALFLIILAVCCLAVGELKNWIHVIDFATAFGGGGVGILTGKAVQQANNGGGTIVNPPPDKEN